MTRHLTHKCTLMVDQTRSRPPTPPGARLLSQVDPLPFLYIPDDFKSATGAKSKKTTKKPNTGKDVPTRKPTISISKGKRKAPPDDEDTVMVGGASDDKAAEVTKQSSEKNKIKSKVPPATASVDDETNDVAMPKKKKMIKLNLANHSASAQSNSLDWANQFNIVSVVDTEVPYCH
jgi:hypothetical protein